MAGCAGVEVGSATTGVAYDGVPHRLLVVGAYHNPGDASRAAFYQGLREAFGRCNVVVDVFPTDGLQLNLAARIKETMATTGADSRLLIQWRREQQIGQNRDETYSVVFQDVKAGADVWKAAIQLSHVNWMTVTGVSDEFAHQIVDGLVKSHVLKTCPAPSTASGSSASPAG